MAAMTKIFAASGFMLAAGASCAMAGEFPMRLSPVAFTAPAFAPGAAATYEGRSAVAGLSNDSGASWAAACAMAGGGLFPLAADVPCAPWAGVAWPGAR
ncbi:hypothetical protein [Methylocella sp.]|uniref:hypothetical protein n=1 Tax=Methylocella sp. TaxID=1978226 RepID=UPI0037831B2B